MPGLYAYGLKCFRSGWTIFDAVLVFSGLFSMVIMPAFFMFYEWWTYTIRI